METLKKLTEAYGPAGREDAVRAVIEDEIRSRCTSVTTDTLGNLIAHVAPVEAKPNEAQRILLCAHMDEIGLIVTYIDKNGFLRFTSVGGIFSNRILHQRVMFANGTTGVIGIEPKSETPPPSTLEPYFIDIGARDRAEAEKAIRIGDLAAFSQTTRILGNRCIAKALDDRIGCYCLIQTLRRIKPSAHDLWFVFTVQEEVGLRGARTSAFGIDPQFALAVDVTTTGDLPESHPMAVALGKGVAIKMMDGAFIAHPGVRDRLVEYASETGIPFQREVLVRGTTDAAVVQSTKAGVASGVLSIPARYVHSTNEMCDLDDVEQTIRLLVLACERGLAKR